MPEAETISVCTQVVRYVWHQLQKNVEGQKYRMDRQFERVLRVKVSGHQKNY